MTTLMVSNILDFKIKNLNYVDVLYSKGLQTQIKEKGNFYSSPSHSKIQFKFMGQEDTHY